MNPDEKEEILITSLPQDRWEDYRNLRLEALSKEDTAFGSSYQEEVDFGRTVWEGRIRNAIFAMKEDVPVGMIVYTVRNRIKTRHVSDIFSLYVTASQRRKGIAEKLLEEATRRIMENSAVIKIQLTVSSAQAGAISLYRKAGFTEAGRLKYELKSGDSLIDEMVMEKIIRDPLKGDVRG